MRDETRDDHIVCWARFVLENPDWKKHHTQFIDAQFEKQAAFLERLAAMPGGKEKIIAIYGIKNLAGYPRLKHE